MTKPCALELRSRWQSAGLEISLTQIESDLVKMSEISSQCPGPSLLFKPRYGWGWKFPDGEESQSYETIDAKGPFLLRVSNAFLWNGAWRGVVGTVAQSGHILDRYRFILWSMTGGDADLVKDVDSRWDFYFSKQEFRQDGIDFVDPDKAGVGYGAPIAIHLKEEL